MIRLRPSERAAIVSETECGDCVFVVVAFPEVKTGEHEFDGGWLTITRTSCAWSDARWRARFARAWRAWHNVPSSAVYVESADELRALRQAIHRAAQVAFPRPPKAVPAPPATKDTP